MANQTMRYETILVLSLTVGEEAVAALGEKFKKMIAEHGEIEKIEEWGKRRLAYPIEDETEGYYILIRFSSSPDFPAELNRVYDITEGVLRTLTVRNELEQQAPAVQAKEAAPAEKAVPAVEEAPAQETAPVVEETAPVVEEAAAQPPVEEAASQDAPEAPAVEE